MQGQKKGIFQVFVVWIMIVFCTPVQAGLTESILREHETHFRLLFDESPLGLFLFDAQGTIKSVNEQFVWLIGSSRELLIGLNTLQLPDQKIVKAIQESLAGGFGRYEGYYHSTTAEKVTPVRVLFAPIKDDSGSILGGLGVIEDISDYMTLQTRTTLFFVFMGILIAAQMILLGLLIRNLRKKNHAEKRLRQSEAQYKQLAENSPAVVYQFRKDADGSISFPYINESVKKVAGIEADDLSKDAMLFLNRIHPEDLEHFQTAVNESARSFHPFYLVFRVLNGEEPVWLECRSTPELMPDGSIMWDGFFVDVTERVRSEKALALSEATYREIFNGVNEGIVIIAPDTGRIMDANDPMLGMFGYSHEELMQCTVEDLSSGHDPYTQKEAAEYSRKALSGMEQRVEWQCRHKKGGLFWAEIRMKASKVAGIPCLLVTLRDITEKKHAQDALRESQTLFRSLVESMPQMVFSKDKQGRFTFANHPYCVDQNLKLDQIIGKTDFEIHPFDLAKKYRSDDLRIMRGKKTMEIEEVHQPLEGEPTYVHVVKAPLLDEEGEAQGLVGIYWDITERKRSEEALQRTQFAMDRARDIVIWVGDQGEIVYVNDAACASSGYTREDLLQMEIFDLDPDFPKEAFEAHKQEMRVKGSMSFESRHRSKNGAIFPVEVSTNYFGTEQEFLACSFARDITDRKNAEKKLRENEEKLRTLYASMTEMVGLYELIRDESGIGIDYRVIDCNSAFAQIMNLPETKIKGKRASQIFELSVPPYLEEYTRVVESGKPERLESISPFHHLHLSTSVVSMGGPRFATISSDVTALKKSQQLIAEKNKELEQIVYVASHDLRSPLVNVDGYSRELGFLVDELSEDLHDLDLSDQSLGNRIIKALPSVHEALSHIRNSTRQMDGLLKGLLRLSRSGRVSLNITEVDMNDLLTRVISGIGFALKESGGEIQVDQLPPCLGDSIQLTHVFTNLISNSLKYRHPDRQGLIRIRGAIKGARCVYSVEDNGIGIAEEHQENIFQLFHRLDPSRSEGEGLGLTIVRQIIERLNGAVWVESKLGEGSVFFVSLPPSPNQQHKSKGVFMND